MWIIVVQQQFCYPSSVLLIKKTWLDSVMDYECFFQVIHLYFFTLVFPSQLFSLVHHSPPSTATLVCTCLSSHFMTSLTSAFHNTELHSATSWAQSLCCYSDMLSWYMESFVEALPSAWNWILLKLTETFILQSTHKAKTHQQCPTQVAALIFLRIKDHL